MKGTEYLPDSLDYFGFGQTKSKRISLSFLEQFSRLRALYLEGHAKHFGTISTLTHLERLTLKSITLPDLELLLPLKQLWSLDISLGGTKNLGLLPQIGTLKYLELWMIKGLQDLSMVGEITSLQNLFLQALKNVSVLPSFSELRQLRRVTLDTMKGITDLSAVAAAPALEELIVVSAPQLSPDDFKPFIGHPTLKKMCIGLGSQRKNEQVQDLLGLPECEGYKTEFSYR
jgi:internalin A